MEGERGGKRDGGTERRREKRNHLGGEDDLLAHFRALPRQPPAKHAQVNDKKPAHRYTP